MGFLLMRGTIHLKTGWTNTVETGTSAMPLEVYGADFRQNWK
jgi:hypothetical protein